MPLHVPLGFVDVDLCTSLELSSFASHSSKMHLFHRPTSSLSLLPLTRPNAIPSQEKEFAHQPWEETKSKAPKRGSRSSVHDILSLLARPLFSLYFTATLLLHTFLGLEHQYSTFHYFSLVSPHSPSTSDTLNLLFLQIQQNSHSFSKRLPFLMFSALRTFFTQNTQKSLFFFFHKNT